MQKSFLKKSAPKAAALLAALMFAGCAAQRPAAVEYKPWAAYLHDDSRSNISTDKVTLPLSVSWTKDVSPFKFYNVFPKEQLSSPAISGGVLYVGSENERFYTLDLKSGKVIWKFDAEYVIEAPPAVSGDHVCFGSSNGILRCLDKATGKLLWSYQARSEILSSPVINDGRVYFSSSDDKLYALSLATGEKLWSYNRATFQTVAPRLYASTAVEGGKLFHFFSDGYLVALSAESGKELWSKKIVKSFDSNRLARRTPLVSEGVVYMIDDTNAVVAMGAENGDTRGLYNIIKAYDFVVPDRKILVLAGSDQVIAINRVTGAILWRKELKHGPVSTVFAAGDYLFMLSNYRVVPLGINFLAKDKGYIAALRLADGETVWGENLKSDVTANASASEDRIAVFTDKGVLEVFGAK